MKKFISFALSLCMILAFCACGQPTAAPEKTELVVFAAASLTETLTEIAELYREAAPNVELIFNFDSSGTLKTQIVEGADCDIFISASPKQMDAVDGETNGDGNDFVLAGSRVELLENKVALVVPAGNPRGIDSYEALAENLKAGSILLAVGNADVPVGQYTRKIFAYYELDETALASSGVLSYGSNVKEVTTQVLEAAVDCGIVYATDAFSAGLTVVDTAAKDMCGQVIYPAAVLKLSRNSEAAQAFLAFLKSAEARAVFEKIGFSSLD